MKRVALLFCASMAACHGALAAQSGDWPCVQRKVPQLSMAQVWTKDPPGADAAAIKSDRDITQMVDVLAARRFPLDEAEKRVTEFADKAGNQKRAKLGALFLALFDRLNRERGDVIAGVERYGRKQLQFADKLRKEQEALAAKRAAANADPTEVKDLTDQLAWDTRIFDDRRKSLSYVCEVPTIIEQRLFGLARAIQKEMD